MNKIELNDWLQILGMVGLIASLIFVGLELRQNQQVARVTAYQALAEQIASYNALLLSESEINQIRNAALNNENLTEEDAEQYRAFWRMLRRQSELAYLQYENGIIDEELLIRTIGPLRDHVNRSEYAKDYWNTSVRLLSDRLGYIPEFESYINRNVLGE
tara:strand:- start:87 stop:566 length:480 start_codon:yes stop_codon:yes gene_type:complete